MAELGWEEDEFLDFWVTYNAGIEQLDLVSQENKSENAQSPAKKDAGAENQNDPGLINHGLGIQLHEDVAETENKGSQLADPATEDTVQIPVENDNGSEDKGGVPVESAAPESPMTREEIILKWLSGLAAAHATEDDMMFQELESRALDTVEQEWGKGWARNRRATGVPRQIPNYRFFDYRTGTYTDLHGAPPPK
ncbi:hypothetical protein CDV55_101699 [Aspergillus turcosus]|uniref:Uncharacterized protein n=1 Tax=Aspergillus turcosus TaxID=1245748 RepID=A0A229WYX0_9EURO|nr:hypothetical protein CDV55_101699 [Aspergillus turcosus]RLL94020.1 hypothetical protein CFD26_102831 [Aspergillus turcosus]